MLHFLNMNQSCDCFYELLSFGFRSTQIRPQNFSSKFSSSGYKNCVSLIEFSSNVLCPVIDAGEFTLLLNAPIHPGDVA